MKMRRVGSITCGVILISLGILCLIHVFYPTLRYEYILRGWPLILISLGVEMLTVNTICTEKMEIKYDIPAVILMFILVAFALMMACVEYGMNLL